VHNTTLAKGGLGLFSLAAHNTTLATV